MTSSKDAMACLPDHRVLNEASESHGEGFWIVSLDRVRRNINSFKDAFREAGVPAVELGWSVKTQWWPEVLKVAFGEGASAEVVSAHEMHLALRLGADPTTLIFNGVGKSIHDIERALTFGARVHLDSEDEVDDLIRLATDHPDRAYRVGLRANVDLGVGQRGRFGLDAESGQLQAAFQRLNALPNVDVVSLHIHASGARAVKNFRARMEALVDLTDQLWQPGSAPAYLDIGGGFCGEVPDELARQMTGPFPSINEYASAIAEVYLRRWPEGGPTLVMEPGVALAADIAWFAAKVLAIKLVAGERHAVTSASVFTVKPMRHPYDMPFIHVPAERSTASGGDNSASTVVSGYTCMEMDILHRNAPASLDRGDWLLFSNCGAYANVLTPRFIRSIPAVLRIEGGTLKPSMRAEDVDDWLQPMVGQA
ncbi:MAG: alanine racemase [Pseudomonadota bacterium]